MHGNRARQAGREAGGQSHLLYATKARWPAADECSAPAIEKEERRYREEARRRRERPALHPLHPYGASQDAACWITNSGNLESPPVKSSPSFPSSSRLSNTITYSPLCFFPSLLSGPLSSVLSPSSVCAAIRSPSSITPQLNICFGMVILWRIFPYSPLLQIHNNA